MNGISGLNFALTQIKVVDRRVGLPHQMEPPLGMLREGHFVVFFLWMGLVSFRVRANKMS